MRIGRLIVFLESRDDPSRRDRFRREGNRRLALKVVEDFSPAAAAALRDEFTQLEQAVYFWRHEKRNT